MGRLLSGIERERAKVVDRREVSASHIEINHLLERGLAAVVEVWAGELDVTQADRFESGVAGAVVFSSPV